MAEYDFYTRAELMDLLKFNESELNKQMVKAEPTEAAAKTAAGNVKTLLKTKIKDIKNAIYMKGLSENIIVIIYQTV